MLSILIPVYRFRVYPLLAGLLEQGNQLGIPIEILLYDDASGFEYSEERKLSESDSRLRIVFLEKNLGRSRIRNKLAADAAYPWLLFMDADSALVSPTYLNTYWNNRSEEVLLNGGTSYASEPPKDKQLYFRWYYGRNREQRAASVRQAAPFEGFSTHHFFCHKDVFKKVCFPDELKGYGHEDTLFGFRLRVAGFSIRHLDNPLEHIGLEDTTSYIKKTKEALDNLHTLRTNYPEVSTRLSKTYDKLRRWRLIWVPALFYRIFGRRLEKHFQSGNPNLLLFDLFRLGYYANRSKRQN
ncbi:MAG: glycosyltransferase family 2 protein [Saprospiraceae bacterium]|nr:glycosyltransferase family 2 protein [Saprospiraceae bacterium]